jgi:hypothetical protein
MLVPAARASLVSRSCADDATLTVDTLSAAASVSWSESETDTDVPVDLVRSVRQVNPLSQIGRRKRVKAEAHAEPTWHKRRGGKPWLDKISVHGAVLGANPVVCAGVCAWLRERAACCRRLSCADNTNWRGPFALADSPTKTNAAGTAPPVDVVVKRGVSDIEIRAGDRLPRVPPLPVMSKFAPNGDDAWDGQPESADRNDDGYYTGSLMDGAVWCASGNNVGPCVAVFMSTCDRSLDATRGRAQLQGEDGTGPAQRSQWCRRLGASLWRRDGARS